MKSSSTDVKSSIDQLVSLTKRELPEAEQISSVDQGLLGIHNINSTVGKICIHNEIQLHAAMGDAPANLAWRFDLYVRIYEACREPDLFRRRTEYMRATFGLDSLTQLSDQQLEHLYHTVMTWARPAR